MKIQFLFKIRLLFFDGSAIEIFSSLLCGGRLRLVSDTDRKEPEMFLKRIKNANIYIFAINVQSSNGLCNNKWPRKGIKFLS